MIAGFMQAVIDMMTPDQQVSSVRIDRRVLSSLVQTRDAFVKTTDCDYKRVDRTALDRFLKFNRVDRRVYQKTAHDCDDFAYILMGDVTRWDPDLAFGIAMVSRPSGRHALNCFVDLDMQLYLVEPQTDEIFTVPDDWRIYFLLF
ncbi:MAG: hypothetical protein ACXQTE_03855 [Methanosarcinaceae archaeon]